MEYVTHNICLLKVSQTNHNIDLLKVNKNSSHPRSSHTLTSKNKKKNFLLCIIKDETSIIKKYNFITQKNQKILLNYLRKKGVLRIMKTCLMMNYMMLLGRQKMKII